LNQQQEEKALCLLNKVLTRKIKMKVKLKNESQILSQERSVINLKVAIHK
jgi:hypothetical protein